ncbi:hypothetical protein [Mucilaginibacter xinganensis]|uniref:Outer membrane protein beta-barrel domain-containing protein n=1 Tax=Mucilaginibacter xinganensis TaxID=1234841 RepID=A0A223NUC7_9SPHI|nr:hypothetical protein [Mucilaginibacter xinganensis]ASU33495.1 hypothetical protein MuYL_1597 [Mucilaginibacter xinganensis]
MKIVFMLLLMLSAAFVWGQATPPRVPAVSKAVIAAGHRSKAGKDTVIESDTSKENKEPRYYYVTASANIFVNTKGGAAKRFSPSVEFGKTFGIFDIGLATGRVNSLSSGADTTRFVEFRPTINIFSKGRFAESLCLGGGYIFKAKQGLMTEICNSINFNISEKLAVAVVQGYYFFDGTNNSRSTQFMGFNFTYNLLKNHSVNKQRKKAAIVSDN